MYRLKDREPADSHSTGSQRLLWRHQSVKCLYVVTHYALLKSNKQTLVYIWLLQMMKIHNMLFAKLLQCWYQFILVDRVNSIEKICQTVVYCIKVLKNIQQTNQYLEIHNNDNFVLFGYWHISGRTNKKFVCMIKCQFVKCNEFVLSPGCEL